MNDQNNSGLVQKYNDTDKYDKNNGGMPIQRTCPCPHCDAEIPANLAYCPRCNKKTTFAGVKGSNATSTVTLAVLIIAVALVLVILSMFGVFGGESTSASTSDASSVADTTVSEILDSSSQE